MSPAEIAARDPQRTAYIVAETGQVVTYAELEADANRGAQLFRSLGLQRGDHIALLLENHADFFQNLLGSATFRLVLHRYKLGAFNRPKWNTSLTTAKRGCS
jgi:acyl-CoA synthetase (AMP-forming)/AMP-acid ligase II